MVFKIRSVNSFHFSPKPYIRNTEVVDKRIEETSLYLQWRLHEVFHGDPNQDTEGEGSRLVV